MAQFSTQLFTSGLELAPLTSDAARPRVFAKSIDHGAPDTTLGERLKLDPPRLVEAVGCVN